MIPYGRHSIDADDIAAVVDVLQGDRLTDGPAVARFEAALGAVTGAPHVVACASGTAALHLAVLGLGLGPGDAVVVPSLTFVATANAATYVGATVRFADVDPDTGLMTPETLEQALARPGPGRPRAVFPVHLNGQVCDMAGLTAVAERHGLSVVEDACHALGGAAVLDGASVPVGAATASAAVCFSFHPVKTVAMGEGGAVTTRDGALADRLRRLRTHGISRDPGVFQEHALAFGADGAPTPWYYEMAEPGFNYRASDLHCALGASQLTKLETFLARRRSLAATLGQALAPLAPHVRPIPRGPTDADGWHLFVVLIDFEGLGRSRADVMAALAAAGIGTQVHYIPVHRQPYYRARDPDLHLPGAEAYYARCLSLPLFPAMADGDVDRVAAALREALQ
ncbi:UDP-4-amino-4,6-dideoxy-N-acetyl-beta-L-altrosamine transaminase [Roseospira marina]|uniref:UDP-4-amino-4, 6-dideoxy-N-acetyl-beta-L-altrosamine transaminase n=1 Tax=Roseospira marina TaxID=140057 RepID=A0A5M6I6H9_9PROT|nr:UDP-4-amino-4,6-dideoxy-N-acetyl-beta-L-altrosamine transaminase [Roseospira marina]KAA5603834.1 UDP-4-amino-4,6-dideoxy-N-acetyl-beta-L-altrosamine transaminase [Roseospira marina]MBB4313779.1 UDP-4-amino-4,6-dideoxy-N-acetyl-beta-L-altrosamine transaminase [Roseospira marina]MBB5086941.1 UDP-4-amino-4,6-dideoxy-N-acetyl-beta-L-altrosamine transaminase [Roseospira marina]